MGINVEMKGMQQPDLTLGGKALDALWKTRWITDSIGNGLEELVDQIAMEAAEMRFQCDRLVICAEGPVADMLRSMLALSQAQPKQKGFHSVTIKKTLVFGGSLSAADYSEVIDEIRSRSCGMIVVALDKESPALCAAFASIRKLIADKYPEEERGKRIKAILGAGSDYLRKEAEIGDMEIMDVPAEIQAAFAGNSLAMFFPMMAAGLDAKEYVRGFREMVASTWWDADGTAYGLSMADLRREEILVWQKELRGLAGWMAAMHRSCGIRAEIRQMPADQEVAQGELTKRHGRATATILFCQEEQTDIMLPVFPGVSPEGSLNQMAKEGAEIWFREQGGSMVSLEEMTAMELGRMAAFLQMSAGITAYAKEQK